MSWLETEWIYTKDTQYEPVSRSMYLELMRDEYNNFLLNRDKYKWQMRDGNFIHIANMKNTHLINTYNMLKRYVDKGNKSNAIIILRWEMICRKLI